MLFRSLKQLRLKSTDEVLVVKNTGGPYISGCVTKTIEKVCRWSQIPSPKTRAVFVIHEFGFPCPLKKISAYQKKKLPIIEDCAYALGSRIEGAKVGVVGDYAIYSLPKYYPIPMGGLLIARQKLKSPDRARRLSASLQKIVLQTLSRSQVFVKVWNRQRRENWKFFSGKFSSRKLPPYFALTKGIVPGVYLMRVPKNFNGAVAKKRLNTAGVEATEYYHQGGFLFPVHQFLTRYEKEYIRDCFFHSPGNFPATKSFR